MAVRESEVVKIILEIQNKIYKKEYDLNQLIKRFKYKNDKAPSGNTRDYHWKDVSDQTEDLSTFG